MSNTPNIAPEVLERFKNADLADPYGYVAAGRELLKLRDLCRRVAEHLGNENHTGIRDLKTHGELWEECERAGWDEGGKER